MTTEKISLMEDKVQKKVIDVLSLFRGEDYAFMTKVIKLVKTYGSENSLFDFTRAVNAIKSANTTTKAE